MPPIYTRDAIFLDFRTLIIRPWFAYGEIKPISLYQYGINCLWNSFSDSVAITNHIFATLIYRDAIWDRIYPIEFQAWFTGSNFIKNSAISGLYSLVYTWLTNLYWDSATSQLK